MNNLKKRINITKTVLASLLLLMVLCFLAPIGVTKAAIQGTDTDPEKLQGSNWMSLISDDRYLNEINIPGTHDAAMAGVEGGTILGDVSKGYARTQSMYIADQLKSGVRMLDIRMTNAKKFEPSDDRVYIVHGQGVSFLDMRYFATKDGKDYYLWDVLDDVTNFLRNNPTETILLELGYEYNSGDEARTYEKAQRHLNIYENRINPSTGKSYIYTENGSNIITTMPKLRDTRGQIVILSKNTSALGYGINYSAGNGYNVNGSVAGKPFSYENHYEADAGHKLEYVQKFFNGGTIEEWPAGASTKAYRKETIYPQTRELYRDVTSHMNRGNLICTTSNVAWSDWKKLGDGPDDVANVVNPWLYGANGLFDNRGKLYGWIYSDFVKPEYIRKLYLTNFPTGSDGLKYHTVTYKNDPSDSSKDKTISVLKGETIELEDCEFLSKDGLSFVGWDSDDTFYRRRTEIEVTEDLTLVPRYQMSWGDLNKQFAGLQKGSEITIDLPCDLFSEITDTSLTIDKDTTVNLRLNGHTIDGGLKKIKGSNFVVLGNLNIIGPGTIENGNSPNGGGIYVGPGGELSLSEGVEVRGNTADRGGGIYINTSYSTLDAGKVVISDSTITNNKSALNHGGGIFAAKDAVIELSGKAVVSNNKWTESETVDSNIQLSDDTEKLIKLKSVLSSGSDVGISVENESTGEGQIPIAEDDGSTSFLTGSLSKFSSDSDKFSVQLGSGDYSRNLVLGMNNPYTVTFDLDGATSGKAPAQQVYNGGMIIQPTRIEKIGYVLLNWLRGTSAFDFNSPVITDSDFTLKANWFKDYMIVKFLSDDKVYYTRAIKPGRKLLSEMPNAPVKEGYIFDCWLEDGEPFDSYKPINKDTTLIAKWVEAHNVTLTFNTGEGASAIPAQSVLYGKCGSRPSDVPTKDGKIFAGWYADSACTTSFDFNKALKEDTTVYAKWDGDPASPTDYRVVFESNGGTKVDSIVVSSGNTATKPSPNPTKEYATFINWFTDATCTNAYDFNTPVTSDIILYAGWDEPSYTVTFNSNGGSVILPQTVKSGNKAIEKLPTKSGSVFEGWYTDDSTFNNRYDFDTPVTKSITLFAKWVQDALKVSFESNGGTEIEDVNVVYGETIVQPTTPKREGYTFEGWYTDAALTVKYNFDSPVIVDMTLYAKWEKEATYDVTFDSNGGSYIAPIKGLQTGTVIDLSDYTPSYSSHTFAGWYMYIDYISVDEMKQIIEDSPEIEDEVWIEDDKVYILCEGNVQINDDTVFRAKWNWLTHTVSFIDDDGTLVTKEEVYDGHTVNRPKDPTNAGLTFKGWYADSLLTTVYDFNTPIYSDISVYSAWDKVYNIVAFDAKGGTDVEGQIVEYGGKVNVPATPSRGDDEFIGWFVFVSDDADFIDEFLKTYPEVSNKFVYKDGALYIPYDFSNEQVYDGIQIVALWNSKSDGSIDTRVNYSSKVENSTTKTKAAKTKDFLFVGAFDILDLFDNVGAFDIFNLFDNVGASDIFNLFDNTNVFKNFTHNL
ncbi:MAG: InlB B-repeat-containing protein [Lachnospiraceae bacterium]|nr:InlB B-repeat-containing protein [Lachnospiraceae bacterium]